MKVKRRIRFILVLLLITLWGFISSTSGSQDLSDDYEEFIQAASLD